MCVTSGLIRKTSGLIVKALKHWRYHLGGDASRVGARSDARGLLNAYECLVLSFKYLNKVKIAHFSLADAGRVAPGSACTSASNEFCCLHCGMH